MSRPVKDPLRPLSEEERAVLEQISRSRSDPAEHVIRAKLLLAVASGMSHSAAARSVGRRSNDAVTHLVSRFNREGLAALAPRSSGGSEPIYGPAERERILREFRRTPEREQDGTAKWSLTALQRSLRRAPDGLARISTHTIWTVLQEAGYRFGRDRTWCHTGVVQRRRKSGVVEMVDPD
ncbi:MAG: helix-turn-helix domain-containing protein, partial [Longimicrobiaceae bacterium]